MMGATRAEVSQSQQSLTAALASAAAGITEQVRETGAQVKAHVSGTGMSTVSAINYTTEQARDAVVNRVGGKVEAAAMGLHCSVVGVGELVTSTRGSSSRNVAELFTA